MSAYVIWDLSLLWYMWAESGYREELHTSDHSPYVGIFILETVCRKKVAADCKKSYVTT
jgi:hypothetical protein